MKKILTIIALFAVIQNVSAKNEYYGQYFNLTQNLGSGLQFFPQNLNVIANYGDSVTFELGALCGNFFFHPSQWFFEGDTIPNTSLAYMIKVLINQPGTYSASIYFCASPIYVYFHVNNITAIPSVKNTNYLDVFPTAVTSSITIQLNLLKPNDLEISFYDINGKQLQTHFYKNISGEFIKNENTEALAKGLYFIKIKAGDEMMQKKFVKI